MPNPEEIEYSLRARCHGYGKYCVDGLFVSAYSSYQEPCEICAGTGFKLTVEELEKVCNFNEDWNDLLSMYTRHNLRPPYTLEQIMAYSRRYK